MFMGCRYTNERNCKVSASTRQILEIKIDGVGMSETVQVLLNEAEVNERIAALGKQISEDYAGKRVHP